MLNDAALHGGYSSESPTLRPVAAAPADSTVSSRLESKCYRSFRAVLRRRPQDPVKQTGDNCFKDVCSGFSVGRVRTQRRFATPNGRVLCWIGIMVVGHYACGMSGFMCDMSRAFQTLLLEISFRLHKSYQLLPLGGNQNKPERWTPYNCKP